MLSNRRNNGFVMADGYGRARTNAYIAGESVDAGMDIFSCGLFLPSGIKKTEAEQNKAIEIIVKCFE